MKNVIDAKTRKEVYERDYRTCIYCNKPLNEDKEITIAHYRTKASCGINTKENLVVLCPVCHGMQHGDLLASKRVYNRMGKYLKRLYPEFYGS